MEIKPLLLGSAAAMIMTSGTHAADPLLAEPEPMDYVKVCDMYGAGFFYIPGTETCLRISGYVDVQYEYSQFDGELQGFVEVSSQGEFGQEDYVSYTLLTIQHSDDHSVGEPVYLARVNFDAREETDFGTLRTYIRFEGEGTNEGGGSVIAKDVYVELEEFSTGYRTTALETGGLLGLMLDGYYGGGRRIYANYTYNANDFTIVLGADLDNGASFTTEQVAKVELPDGQVAYLDGILVRDYSLSSGGNGKSVNPYLVASYSHSMYSVRGKIGHDTSAGEQHFGVDGSLAFVPGATLRGYWERNTGVNEYGFTSDYLSFFPTTKFLSSDESIQRSTYVRYSEQAWGIGATYQVTPELALAAGYSSASFFDAGIDAIDDMESYVVGMDWNPVDNLVLRVNYRHQNWGAPYSDAEVDELRVRLRRTF